MSRPRLPLGEYYQLLLKHGLLADHTPLNADLLRPVEAVTCDSRAVVPGSLFLCKGAAFKEDYLVQALRQGAVAYVSQRPYPVPAPCIQVTDVRAAMGLLADAAWGHPSARLKIIGITGTKGKTTTAYFLKTILDLWRKDQGLAPVGLLSTIVTDDGVQRRPAVLTTPEPLDLQRHLWNGAESGCGYMVMECSSQALKYGRLTGVELETAVFLNIGEDHISPQEHPTLEDYFQSKLKIFRQARTAVVNLDSDRAAEVLAGAAGCQRTLTYSLDNPGADLSAGGLRRQGEGLAFWAQCQGQRGEYSISFPGEFNVSNALAALTVCRELGVPEETIRRGLAQTQVPGRMETYSAQGKTVIVDYAHNGMALSALLRAARADHPGAFVSVVFGCTGGKGLDRREGMGLAAGELADAVFLTEDDPGPETVEDICTQVGEYVTQAGGSYTVIPDREQAVRQAIETAPAGAVILLAGKGSEQVQKRKYGPEPCVPDGLLARKYLGLPLERGL